MRIFRTNAGGPFYPPAHLGIAMNRDESIKAISTHAVEGAMGNAPADQCKHIINVLHAMPITDPVAEFAHFLARELADPNITPARSRWLNSLRGNVRKLARGE